MIRKSFRSMAAVLLVASMTHGVAQDRAEASLKSAMDKEMMDGNLKAAIEEYKKLAQNSNQSVAARAMVRLGECYEKQGNAAARQTYEQVVARFGNQTEAVAEARTRLAALGAGGATSATLVWQGGYPSRSIATDKPLVLHWNARTDDLMLLNLATGEERPLTDVAGKPEKFTNGVISADGRMVVYRWDFTREGKEEIRTIGIDGSGMRIHYSGKMTPAITPQAISPDKKTVLVSTLIEKSESAPMHTILQSLSLADGSLRPFAEGFWGVHVSYSPDGKMVVLHGRPASGSDHNSLFVANADGSGLRTVFTEYGGDPRWTPDGKSIVFISERSGVRRCGPSLPTAANPVS